MADDDWAPDECTLPTTERPLRHEEFDDLFEFLVQSTRPASTRLDLVLPHSFETAARDLAHRETECCSFFTFGFESTGKYVVMHIDVPGTHVEVLDAIEARL